MSVIAPSTKEQIVLAAEALFAERGVEGVSLRQIGAAAGNGNNSAVQYHFGTKDRLVQAGFEYRLPRPRERRDPLLAARRPHDPRPSGGGGGPGEVVESGAPRRNTH